LKDEPITPDEFQRALKKIKVDFAETSETASGVAEAIGEAVTVARDIGAYLDYPKVLREMTLEMVHKVARDYLALDKAYTAVLVPNGEPEASEGDDADE